MKNFETVRNISAINKNEELFCKDGSIDLISFVNFNFSSFLSSILVLVDKAIAIIPPIIYNSIAYWDPYKYFEIEQKIDQTPTVMNVNCNVEMFLIFAKNEWRIKKNEGSMT